MSLNDAGWIARAATGMRCGYLGPTQITDLPADDDVVVAKDFL
jgi:hypothetical protein